MTAPGKHVLVLGASGLVGHAAARHFATEPGCQVTAVSRNRPLVDTGAAYLELNLLDATAVTTALHGLPPVSHVVYTAVREQVNLVSGWTDEAHVAANGRMLSNVLDALSATETLRHVTLLQGPKAYGVHVGPMPLPAREGRHERRDVPNFYWAQQDEVVARQGARATWRWTIFRPVMVVGEAVGASMNLIAALGAYAAICREDGLHLPFPGTPGLIKQPTDVDLLASAIAWAGECPRAADQVFNIDNGEVCTLDGLWPAICDALGMQPGEPRRTSLAEMLPMRAADWDRIRERERLAAPALDRFLGSSPQLADFSLGIGAHGLQGPAILSSVKLRQAGFHNTLDSETMVRKWFGRYQQHGLLPLPRPALA